MQYPRAIQYRTHHVVQYPNAVQFPRAGRYCTVIRTILQELYRLQRLWGKYQMQEQSHGLYPYKDTQTFHPHSLIIRMNQVGPTREPVLLQTS